MPGPNPAIIPGLQPVDLPAENDDLLPGEGPHFGKREPDTKDGMPNDDDAPEPVPNAI